MKCFMDGLPFPTPGRAALPTITVVSGAARGSEGRPTERLQLTRNSVYMTL
jgi:hypothetical protein